MGQVEQCFVVELTFITTQCGGINMPEMQLLCPGLNSLLHSYCARFTLEKAKHTECENLTFKLFRDALRSKPLSHFPEFFLIYHVERVINSSLPSVLTPKTGLMISKERSKERRNNMVEV